MTAETTGVAHLFWLDMEMTGLEPETDTILEVAAIVTDMDLNTLETYEAVVHQSDERLGAMDDWCTRTHTASGLVERVQASTLTEADIDRGLRELADRHWGPDDRVVLCGNSIGQDRRFVDAYLPEFAARLHYRIIDVSSFKELLATKYGLKFDKKQRHRALDDILESIGELGYYLQFFSPPEG